MRIEPLSEYAYILRDLGDVKPYALAEALCKDPRIIEAAPSYETVGVYVGPAFEATALDEILSNVELNSDIAQKSHVIPVCYELGPDLSEIARFLGMKEHEVIEHHFGATYVCHAIGFQPGFPFLGYLPEPLKGVPRRPSPRPNVPIGSIGITGKQTGIYPSESPGGWALIGQTPLCLVDLDDAYFPISAGDEVHFVPISLQEFEARRGERL